MFRIVMHPTNLKKAGDSVMRGVPPARPRPRYALEELLAQGNRKAPRSKEERAWLSCKRAGRELI